MNKAVDFFFDFCLDNEADMNEGKHLSPPRGKFGIHQITPTGQKI
jgi:hypothetical protein